MNRNRAHGESLEVQPGKVIRPPGNAAPQLLSRLHERHRELLQALGEAQGKLRDWKGWEKQGAAEAEGEPVTLAEIRRLEDALRQTDTALDMAEQGRYGECIRCGGNIAKARLIALLSVTTCVRCEEAGGWNSPEQDSDSRTGWELVADTERSHKDYYAEDPTADALHNLEMEDK